VEAPPETSAAFRAARLVCSRWLAILVLSGIILIPCYWHRRIEAGDLGSHTYNAWLAFLAARGQAPGLHVFPQSNNILVDLGLCWLGGLVGFIGAEKIIVSVCVLCFFWGAFALIAAYTGREPWHLVPAIMMIAYGYTFYAGLMNYYLSLGLAFGAAALVHRGTRLDWIGAAALAILTFIAHPMGFGLLLAIVAYTRLADAAHGRYRWFALTLCLVTLVGIHFAILKFKVEAGAGLHGLLFTGTDQLMLFGAPYKLLSRTVLVLGGVGFIVAAIGDLEVSPLLPKIWTPLTLWAVLVMTAVIVPGAIWLPQYNAAFSAIAARLTSVTAIFGLCVLGSVRPRKWIFRGTAAFAVVFFALQYRDTRTLNKMEEQAEALVSDLPFGARVSYTLELSDQNRINFRHFVDRVCIGKCFAYSNYEPGSGQFRVRISPAGSPLVSASGLAMELGEYIVRSADLPMAQIYQPDERDLTKLAIRDLIPGEKNGRVGHHPPASEIAERLQQPAQ
jgi:hypothetical protein